MATVPGVRIAVNMTALKRNRLTSSNADGQRIKIKKAIK